ncbi:hypothetical protein LLG95_06790 [bacterium]|nr:hypothetical protein [bacterium]
MSRNEAKAVRLVSPALLFCLAAPAHANDFMFSAAAVTVIGPAFLLWFAIGLMLRANGYKLQFIGAGAALVVFVSIFIITGHVEIAICCWMIYLALVTTCAAFQKNRDASRRINLIFHGSFLAIVIAGGAIAKAIYWSNNGGFAAWSVQMQETYPAFLYGFGVLALMVIGWSIVRGCSARKSDR